MTPVIIHYKDNKKDDGFDLRMTLRSFDMFMPYVGQVIVVGDRHEWMSGMVTHIPYRHPYANNKDANIMMACVKGAAYLITEHKYDGDVIVASDDCILLQAYSPVLYYEEEAYQFMEAFPRRLKDNPWWERPYQAIVHCMTLGWTTDNCEAHVPQFLSVGSIMTLIDARIGESSLGSKTIMVNAERTLGGRPAEKAGPHKIHPDRLTKEMVGAVRFCNWSPATETVAFKETLRGIFNKPSKYEI